MKTLLRMVIVGISLSVCFSAFYADNITKVTYKWIDEKGIIQYTEHPPANAAYEKITVKASGGQEVTSVANEKKSDDEKEDTAYKNFDEVIEANIRNCKIARQNMEVLTNIANIKVSDNEGENRILSPEEKQSRIQETQKQIDIYCKDINADLPSH